MSLIISTLYSLSTPRPPPAIRFQFPFQKHLCCEQPLCASEYPSSCWMNSYCFTWEKSSYVSDFPHYPLLFNQMVIHLSGPKARYCYFLTEYLEVLAHSLKQSSFNSVVKSKIITIPFPYLLHWFPLISSTRFYKNIACKYIIACLFWMDH